MTNKCGAVFFIADDFGDNHATMKCQLEEGHAGPHKESGTQRRYTFTWEVDERTPCGRCKKMISDGMWCYNDDCVWTSPLCETCNNPDRPFYEQLCPDCLKLKEEGKILKDKKE